MIPRTLYVAAAVAVAVSFTPVSSFAPTLATSTSIMASSISTSSSTTAPISTPLSTTALSMAGVRTRGLEQRKEGPTPTEGGMILYLKAAEDGTSVGDCPFGHYISMILEEKGLRYDVQPCSSEDDSGKPNWLLDFYEGKIPCLRHKKEAYVESSVIAAYLDYFFLNDVKPSPESKAAIEDAEEALTGLFPAVAGYLKDVDGDDDESATTLDDLKERLASLETHLSKGGEEGNCYLDLSDNDTFNSLDCRLVPQLYHLQVGIEKFKNGRPNLETEFPHTHSYLTRSMERPSFQNTKYSPETIEWGWSNARR